MPESRSYEPIQPADLAVLAGIARADREAMFAGNERWRPYRDLVLCVCLCQGAALHYLDGASGVKDFDLWTFFARSPVRPHPDPALFRRNARGDFGPSRFGRTLTAPARIQGRRVDLLSRSLDAPPGADPAAAVRAWLETARETSARMLARKAVVLVDPRPGEVVWTPR